MFAICVEADKHIEELRVKDCPALSRIDHGDYNVTGPVGHDAIVGVNCHNGYRINGSARLKCSDFGSWNGVQPSCQAITCRRISEPHQGTSNVSGSQSFHIGDMVELHCNANYKLVGESIITCTETGEWSSGVPFCEEIKCWELLPVLDGSWIYNETGPARPGTRAVLKCDNVLDNIIGHALICTQNGTWVSEVMARSKQPNLDLSNYMPFCAPKKDGRNVVSRVLLIIGCIGSSLVTAAAGLCVWVTALRCKRKSVNLSSSSLDKGTNDEQIALINGENTLPKFIETNEQHNSRNNRMLRNANENGIQVIQVVNHVRASCSQTDNREMQTNVNLSHPAGGDDDTDDFSQGGNDSDGRRPHTPEYYFPTQETDDQSNEETNPKSPEMTNAQTENGVHHFGSNVIPLDSDIAQLDLSVTQPFLSRTNTSYPSRIHSQPATDTESDQNAAKILPSSGMQPIHEDDISKH
ncbi:uncharacterized protein LOC128242307 isoform X2 [Mya arenaria]|uniref:uncharacterized protein LOC128242307 isoform X2 n=1 Tax=Mya arenaria TaxID=6604 RepID=UPI0022E0167C|nr:uncharacterized protein LOC128242307 isoform X2 [Mya arenaria]